MYISSHTVRLELSKNAPSKVENEKPIFNYRSSNKFFTIKMKTESC